MNKAKKGDKLDHSKMMKPPKKEDVMKVSPRKAMGMGKKPSGSKKGSGKNC